MTQSRKSQSASFILRSPITFVVLDPANEPVSATIMARKKKSKQTKAAANGISNGTAAPAAEAAPAPAESSRPTEAPAAAAPAPTAAPSTWDGNAMTQDDMMLKDTVLVLDDDDNVIGSESKKGSHLFNAKTQRGVLHRAFSVFLFDESTGELLLQQRASTKITFPNVRALPNIYTCLYEFLSMRLLFILCCDCVLTRCLSPIAYLKTQHIHK